MLAECFATWKCGTGGRNPAWSAILSVWLSMYQTSASDSPLALSAQICCCSVCSTAPSPHPATKVFRKVSPPTSWELPWVLFWQASMAQGRSSACLCFESSTCLFTLLAVQVGKTPCNWIKERLSHKWMAAKKRLFWGKPGFLFKLCIKLSSRVCTVGFKSYFL